MQASKDELKKIARRRVESSDPVVRADTILELLKMRSGVGTIGTIGTIGPSAIANEVMMMRRVASILDESTIKDYGGLATVIEMRARTHFSELNIRATNACDMKSTEEWAARLSDSTRALVDHGNMLSFIERERAERPSPDRNRKSVIELTEQDICALSCHDPWPLRAKEGE